ncbi:MAG: endonuclease III [Planctomycetota bacterium]|nr:endonuclease III [Planctomycetota bacterium]
MSRESHSDQTKRTAKILAKLKALYPGARTALRHRDPLQMLVATILSAQCTDVRVNLVTETLFQKYRTAAQFARARQTSLEREIHSTGFYHNKAKNIRAAAAMIVEKFGGRVPETMDELLTLPGVARKTANCVLESAFGISEGITVDTHVIRLSGRLGFSKHKNAAKIEEDLMALVAKKDWAAVSHLLILHGRAVCSARKPDCKGCPVRSLCPSAFKV